MSDPSVVPTGPGAPDPDAPMTGVIEAFRWMMLSGYTPATGAIVIALVETAVLAVVGWLVFARLETTMADEI